MEVESMPARSRGGNYSALEVMAHSNCLMAFAIILGFLMFAICLGIGIAVNWELVGFGLYVFLVCGLALFICVCIIGWQFNLLRIERDERVKDLKEQDQRIAIRARALKAFDQADKQGDNAKLRLSDKELALDIIRSTMNVRQQSSRVVEERQQAALPGPSRPQIAGSRSPLAVDPRLLAQRKVLESIHVPTFAEALQLGLIGPGQEQILICYEIEVNEMTGEVTGQIKPYRDLLSNNCTMFLGGGSKSGKSTLMAALAAQEAMMGALFYIIDPHLAHPEKSIARKLESLQHAFILPPAVTEEEIKLVLEHAEHEAWCRTQNPPIETPYTGRSIVFVVDESLALFGNAQRNSEDKELQKFYRRLALFMRDLGTAYNKFDMNGIFATQFLTKEAFRLPGGFNIDFRDACQNQTLLRLPPNQAQVMRLLQREELREMRTMRPGFGFMGFATGDIIRMCSGNITKQDIESIAPMVSPAPRISRQFTGWAAPQPSKTVESDTPEMGAGVGRPRPQESIERSGVVSSGPYPMMNESQIAQFRESFPDARSLDTCLDAIPGCNHRHREHARMLIEQYGLVRRRKVQ